jgi:hypothetical protein
MGRQTCWPGSYHNKNQVLTRVLHDLNQLKTTNPVGEPPHNLKSHCKELGIKIIVFLRTEMCKLILRWLLDLINFSTLSV